MSGNSYPRRTRTLRDYEFTLSGTSSNHKFTGSFEIRQQNPQQQCSSNAMSVTAKQGQSGRG